VVLLNCVVSWVLFVERTKLENLGCGGERGGFWLPGLGGREADGGGGETRNVGPFQTASCSLCWGRAGVVFGKGGLQGGGKKSEYLKKKKKKILERKI